METVYNEWTDKQWHDFHAKNRVSREQYKRELIAKATWKDKKNQLTYDDLLIIGQTILGEHKKKQSLLEIEFNAPIDQLDFGQDELWKTFLEESSYSLTGIEPCLYGIYLDQIIELNKYVFTTVSTNEPHDPEFQEMFVGGLMINSMLSGLIAFCKEKGYNYTFKNADTLKYIAISDSDHLGDFAKVGVGNIATYKDIYDKNTIKPVPVDFGGLDQYCMELAPMLIEFEIIDPIQSRRDLYSNLLTYLSINF